MEKQELAVTLTMREVYERICSKFSAIEVFRELGLNEWALNEGADPDSTFTFGREACRLIGIGDGEFAGRSALCSSCSIDKPDKEEVKKFYYIATGYNNRNFEEQEFEFFTDSDTHAMYEILRNFIQDKIDLLKVMKLSNTDLSNNANKVVFDIKEYERNN